MTSADVVPASVCETQGNDVTLRSGCRLHACANSMLVSLLLLVPTFKSHK